MKFSNFIVLVLFTSIALGQTSKIKVVEGGITINNTSDQSPDPTAILDVSSLDKGILLPRLTQVQIDAIAVPTLGLIVFNINENVYEFWDGLSWQAMKVSVASTPPDTPSGLLAITSLGNQIDLSWTDNSDDETGFEIWRSLTSTTGFELTGSTSADETTFSDLDLAYDREYFYQIRAVSNAGFSEYSNESSAVTANPFVSEWNTSNTSLGSSANNQVKLPLVSNGTYDFTVDWGDGSSDVITTWSQAEATHTYASVGSYTISIIGTIRGWRFVNTGDKMKILDVIRWGSLAFGPTTYHFYGCGNLVVSATDAPDLSYTTSLYGSFRDCYSLTRHSSFNNFDVSNITNLSYCFYNSAGFNSDISSWNVSAVNNIYRIFGNAKLFNQDIGGWDVSSITNLSYMFNGAISFNQDLSDWDVSSVTNLSYMFYGAAVFDQDLSSWDVSLCTNFQMMFGSTSSFNQDLSSWNMSSATNISYMFYNAQSFNQDISSWNTSLCTTMRWMFYNARAFNQNINSWDVSSVTDMSYMFYNALGFDQNLGSWDISSLTNGSYLFRNVTLSTANLDAIYIGWSANTHNSGVSFHGGSGNYTLGGSAEAGRAVLTGDSWSITDGGGI